MEAPDKIYIEQKAVMYDLVNTEPCKPDDYEYLRKDALLDYFRQRVEDLNSPLNGVFGSTEREHCNERISELLLLIDRLNEM